MFECSRCDSAADGMCQAPQLNTPRESMSDLVICTLSGSGSCGSLKHLVAMGLNADRIEPFLLEISGPKESVVVVCVPR